MVELGIKALDRTLGGIKEHSYILLHEEDPRSLGRELVFEFMRRKLDEDNLIGFFNISHPLSILIDMLERRGIRVRAYLDSLNLAIVDTFGSFYGPRLERRGIWYLSGSLSYELLSRKYAEAVRAHKELWKNENMFEGRELWGVAMDVSEYSSIFGETNALSYFEVSAEIRRRHRAYREYPTGTNIWVFSGKQDRVFSSLYRRVDYVMRTRSELTEDGVKRYLHVLKAPGVSEIITFEYAFTGKGIELERID
ncbi:hypothetical protein A3L09_08480 [Thermococcus profundus]|uniref:Uncharacterized protein n=1 Tax=Thermococcus profundus TaxID=49899 RepID=A0A2Z2MA90_THEPR|nr:hypothetical protein [Thermococcus profundus]ASJ03287.1 hypothetical protein A3L09_08480 [Thermococcus profundus]